jgi:hypothetical protein
MIVFPTAAQTVDDPTTDTVTQDSTPPVMREPRIVGGKPAIPGQFPYQVLLLLSNQNYR